MTEDEYLNLSDKEKDKWRKENPLKDFNKIEWTEELRETLKQRNKEAREILA